jgi:hypothetical protein
MRSLLRMFCPFVSSRSSSPSVGAHTGSFIGVADVSRNYNDGVGFPLVKLRSLGAAAVFGWQRNQIS